MTTLTPEMREALLPTLADLSAEERDRLAAYIALAVEQAVLDWRTETTVRRLYRRLQPDLGHDGACEEIAEARVASAATAERIVYLRWPRQPERRAVEVERE